MRRALRQLLARAFGWFARDEATKENEHSLGKVNLRKLEKIIGHKINDPKLFIEALSHQSYRDITGNNEISSYERLEFLGDAILSLVVAEYLFQHYPTASEGELTKTRSRLINRKSLTAYARNIKLESFLLTKLNSPHSFGRGLDKILADAFEALIAAIYLDSGYTQAQRFINEQIKTAIRKRLVRLMDENYKSQLLEFYQSKGWGFPKYVTIQEEGPNHDITFTVEVHLNGKPYGKGVGKTKKTAEQEAAANALQNLRQVS